MNLAPDNFAGVWDPLLSCCQNADPQTVLLNLWIAAVTLAEVLVLSLTWKRTFYDRREAAALGITTPITHLLLRDGEI